jgi:hypothetical protein
MGRWVVGKEKSDAEEWAGSVEGRWRSCRGVGGYRFNLLGNPLNFREDVLERGGVGVLGADLHRLANDPRLGFEGAVEVPPLVKEAAARGFYPLHLVSEEAGIDLIFVGELVRPLFPRIHDRQGAKTGGPARGV